MKGPISTIALCLAIVLVALGYGLWERHVGAQQEAARVHADSLLKASQIAQDSILRADSLQTAQSNHTRDSLSTRLRALQRDYGASQRHVDSAAVLALKDSLVPRDTVAALVAVFQGERHKADSTIQTLVADTLLLVGRIAQQDRTIRGLTTQLAAARAEWAEALKPPGSSLLDKIGRLGEAALALRGALAVVGH